jgi:polysaccharide biosynthesis protein PslH
MIKILLISNWFPYPPINGAKIRTYNLIRQLSKFANVDLISLVRTLDPEQLRIGKEKVEEYCHIVDTIPAKKYMPGETPFYKKLIDNLPDSVRKTINADLENLLQETYSKNKYDVIWVCENGEPSVLSFSAVKLGLRPLILDSLELGTLRPNGAIFSSRRFKTTLTWLKARRFIHWLLQSTDAFSVSSENERQLFKNLIPQKTICTIIPHGIELTDYQENYGERDRFTIIHTGSFSYSANYEAVKWFAEQVFPNIRMKDEIRILITGLTAGRDLAPITQYIPQVEFTGLVANIYPRIAQSRMSIVPILTGGSTRLKIVEAMALKTPVVSTKLGAEGLDVCHEKDILLAENPSEFARHIDRLIEDDGLWEKLSRAGYMLVQQKYSADIIGRKASELFQALNIDESGS